MAVAAAEGSCVASTAVIGTGDEAVSGKDAGGVAVGELAVVAAAETIAADDCVVLLFAVAAALVRSSPCEVDSETNISKQRTHTMVQNT